MSLAEALRSALHHFHLHATSQTNQGAVHLIEGHIARLQQVIHDAEAGDAEGVKVLEELYGALNAPAPVVIADVAKAAAAVAAGAAKPRAAAKAKQGAEA